VRAHLTACRESAGEIMRWEFRKVRKDGSVMHVHEMARAVRHPDGSPVVLIVCEDVTERTT
jgi:PAS domain S-box-containing protein